MRAPNLENLPLEADTLKSLKKVYQKSPICKSKVSSKKPVVNLFFNNNHKRNSNMTPCTSINDYQTNVFHAKSNNSTFECKISKIPSSKSRNYHLSVKNIQNFLQ
uniref:Uncharacterized protein n=1 Tax=Strongyloides papillosus TaxID=174720 RepID=A0A0N5C7I3_STREA